MDALQFTVQYCSLVVFNVFRIFCQIWRFTWRRASDVQKLSCHYALILLVCGSEVIHRNGKRYFESKQKLKYFYLSTKSIQLFI